MHLTIPTSRPFSFAQTLAFARRFPPCRHQLALDATSLATAFVVGGRPIAVTLRGGGALELELASGLAPAQRDAAALHAARLVGANDDIAAFYAIARDDATLRPIVEALHGLHHLRFRTLAEIAVYSVLMQRAPVTVAATLLGRFLSAFGAPVEVGGRRVFAMPDLADVSGLTAAQIAGAIGNRAKAARIVDVVRGVRVVGEALLRDAPYAEARDALLAIRGIGPFSAAAILLRGLGRMDELPWLPAFAEHASAVYAATIDHAAIAARYGRMIGYWSFYVMAGLGRASTGALPSS
jgi:DNA-3-methyladenine glycosylase II